MKLGFTVTHRYRDHQQIVKAIENSSLQASFGAEITSTSDLIPKQPDVSSGNVLNNSTINSVNNRARFDWIPFIFPQSRNVAGLLPANLTTENGNVTSDLTGIQGGIPAVATNENGSVTSHVVTNHGDLPVVATNQRGNIPSAWLKTGGIIPAVSSYEDGGTASVQCDFLGQVPADVWSQKVNSHTSSPLFGSFADFVSDC